MDEEILLIRALGSGSISLPFGILSIDKYLKDNGYESTIFDRYTNTDINILITKIKSLTKLKVVGLSAMTIQLPDALYIAKIIKEIRPNIKIVMGGVHVTALPYSVKEFVDHIFMSEGENAMLKFVKNGYEGDYILRGKPLQDLNSVSFFDIDLIGKLLGNQKLMYVMTSRGCPYRCNFCLGKEQRVKGIRYIDIDRVVDYIKEIVDRLGVTDFFITDDIFVMNRKRVVKFCELIREKIKKKISLNCFTHSGHGDAELYKLMKSVGFDKISIGIEHGTDELLDYCGKRTTLKIIDRTCSQIYNAGLKVNGCFIVGNLPETNETITKTVDFAIYIHKKFKSSSWISYAQPLPGSKLYTDSLLSGTVIERDFSKWDNESLVYVPKNVEEDHIISERHRGMRKANDFNILGKVDGGISLLRKLGGYVSVEDLRSIELSRVLKIITIDKDYLKSALYGSERNKTLFSV